MQSTRWALAASVVAFGAVAGPAAAAPSNDAFANARTLERASGEARAHSVGATEEPGEPDHAGNAGGRSVWFRWVAPRSGQFAFVTFGSDFDTLLAVYTGSSVTALTPVAANDDAGKGIEQSMVSFRATQGVEYRLAVDGFAGKTGTILLQWLPSPPNDNFADAFPLPSEFGRVRVTTAGSTWEAGEPAHDRRYDDDSVDGATVWFRWTSAETGLVSFSTERSDVDTVVAVYVGENVAELERVTLNDDDRVFSGTLLSRAIFAVTAGQTYRIALDSIDGWGTSTLVWRRALRGTAGRDSLTGSSQDEEIYGLGGADRLRGGGGDDLILGGPGADVLLGGAGADLSVGGTGRDAIVDRLGRDVLEGGDGDDRLDALDRSRGDVLVGGRGRDRCRADRRDTRNGCP